MNRALIHTLVACSFAALACGGGNDSGGPTPAPDAGGAQVQDSPPTVYSDLTELAGVSGTKTVRVDARDDVWVMKVALFVDDLSTPVMEHTEAPFDFAWDTTKIADGLHSVVLRATDNRGQTGDSAAVRVIVFNTAKEATYLDGNSWHVSIPSTYPNVTGELDTKHHWMMPAGSRRSSPRSSGRSRRTRARRPGASRWRSAPASAPTAARSSARRRRPRPPRR